MKRRQWDVSQSALPADSSEADINRHHNERYTWYGLDDDGLSRIQSGDGRLYLGIEICFDPLRIDFDDKSETNLRFSVLQHRSVFPPAGDWMDGQEIAAGKV